MMLGVIFFQRGSDWVRCSLALSDKCDCVRYVKQLVEQRAKDKRRRWHGIVGAAVVDNDKKPIWRANYIIDAHHWCEEFLDVKLKKYQI